MVPYFNRFDNWYGTVLQWSLKHKTLIIICSFVIFFSSLFLTGSLGSEFIPETDEARLSISVELQAGTRLDNTVVIARKIDSLLLNKYPEILVVSTSAGTDDEGGMLSIFQSTGTHIINYIMKLQDESERERSVWEIAELIRKDINNIPEVINYTVSTGGMTSSMSGGNTINVEIYGYNLDETTVLAHQIADSIRQLPNSRDINISREEATPELKIELDREKMYAVGLNTATISTALYNRVLGLTATYLRE
jgi:HAE1 family hydrophobic/amphiphilic exporter-1